MKARMKIGLVGLMVVMVNSVFAHRINDSNHRFTVRDDINLYVSMAPWHAESGLCPSGICLDAPRVEIFIDGGLYFHDPETDWHHGSMFCEIWIDGESWSGGRHYGYCDRSATSQGVLMGGLEWDTPYTVRVMTTRGDDDIVKQSNIVAFRTPVQPQITACEKYEAVFIGCRSQIDIKKSS